MTTEKIELELRAANPIGKGTLGALDLTAGEEALGRALLSEAGRADEPGADELSGRRRRALPAFAAMTAVAAAAAIFLFAARGTDSPSRAYGAELVRFAESTPLLLLEGPGWRVRHVNEQANGQGQMQFVTGPSTSPEAHLTRRDVKRHVVPPAVSQLRQQRVELSWYDSRQVKLVWHDGKLGRSLYSPYQHKRVTVYERGRGFKTTIPALETTAYVDPRTENTPIQGGPGDRLMVALWEENDHLLELRASVPDLAAFRERLGWLHRVDAQAWLDAMPANVVKAAAYGAAIHEMLRGIPLPPGFDPAQIPNLGLTTERYQVGAAVGGAVACAWFGRWGEARAAGDIAAAQEAEQVLLHSESQWPIFREMSKEGAYPATIVEYAKAMPSGRWYGRPLLPDVNQGLGCASFGFPLRSEHKD